MSENWWEADEDRVAQEVFAYVGEVERVQSKIFERFIRLASLYDPYADVDASAYWPKGGSPWGGPDGIVSENLIASNVDTVCAEISATDVRVRFMTDDADWAEQRRARHLEFYVEALCKKLGVDEIHRDQFKVGALKGTALVKVWVDWAEKTPRVALVQPDDIVVDEQETRNGRPMQMHERAFIDRDVLRAAYPDASDAIDQAQRDDRGGSWSRWAGYRPLVRNELVVLESYRLAVGNSGTEYHRPGRHVVCIDGAVLIDEEWTEDFFPYAEFRWSRRPGKYYGIGLGERISGHQRRKNKINWQTDRQLDHHSAPVTYVGQADANLAVKTINRVGTIAVVKGPPPTTVIPQAVSPELLRRGEQVTESAFEETGLSRMAATSRKPPGLVSGRALMEYRDQRSMRFALPEKGFENSKLRIAWLLVWACKQLGDDAPAMLRRSRFGRKKFEWGDVDIEDARLQVYAASNLARTPAGRQQLALDWAQAGVITADEARRLAGHEDVEHTWSTFTAALENIERMIDESLDGEVIIPEPYHNLKLLVWRYNQEYQLAEMNGAPEEILDSLQVTIRQAAWMLSLAEAPPVPQPMENQAMPGPGAGPPELLPGAIPTGAPQAAPQAAFAPQAMDLIAK